MRRATAAVLLLAMLVGAMAYEDIAPTKKDIAAMKKAEKEAAKEAAKKAKEEAKTDKKDDKWYGDVAGLDGECSGTPVCYPQYHPITWSAPKYQCPEGFILGNYYGSLKCIKTVHSCEKGLTLTSGKKCCESCPSNCKQQGNLCLAPAQQQCAMQSTPCEPDCEQTLVCSEDGKKFALGMKKAKEAVKVYEDKQDPKYAPAFCKYECCKTVQPAFPLKCYASTTATEWCEPTVLCPKGTAYDKDNAQCLVSQGGWDKCPKGGKVCTCADKPFCVSAPKFFGVDACKMFCSCLGDMKVPNCAIETYDPKAKY